MVGLASGGWGRLEAKFEPKCWGACLGLSRFPPFPLCSNGFLRSASHSPEWRGWTEGGAGWRGDGGSQKAGWRVGWRGADGVWRAGGPDGRLDGGRLGSVDGGMG